MKASRIVCFEFQLEADQELTKEQIDYFFHKRLNPQFSIDSGDPVIKIKEWRSFPDRRRKPNK